MKKFIIITFFFAAIAVIIIAIIGFVRFNFTSGGDIIPGTNANVAQLICTQGYSAEAIYYAPNKNGVMEKLLLNMTKDGVKTQYYMIPALSASGAKFETKTGDFSFWEHQDEFTLAKSGETITVCRRSPDATYTIDGQTVTLVNGLAEEAIPGSAAKIITRYFGNEVRGDFNNDGYSDLAFVLTQETGGSGTFYYLALALGTDKGYHGSPAVFLGDRISPQITMLDEKNPEQIIISYSERKVAGVESAMVSRTFKVENNQLVEIK